MIKENLKQLIKKSKINKKELSVFVFGDKKSLKKYFKGKIPLQVGQLEKLATLYMLTVDELKNKINHKERFVLNFKKHKLKYNNSIMDIYKIYKISMNILEMEKIIERSRENG